jgi:hypothetical protein
MMLLKMRPRGVGLRTQAGRTDKSERYPQRAEKHSGPVIRSGTRGPCGLCDACRRSGPRVLCGSINPRGPCDPDGSCGPPVFRLETVETVGALGCVPSDTRLTVAPGQPSGVCARPEATAVRPRISVSPNGVNDRRNFMQPPLRGELPTRARRYRRGLKTGIGRLPHFGGGYSLFCLFEWFGGSAEGGGAHDESVSEWISESLNCLCTRYRACG